MRILKIGTEGTDVKKLQAILDKYNYNPGQIDGIFSYKTSFAIKNFQSSHNIKESGVVDFQTQRILNQYLFGYKYYRVKRDDCIHKIANTNNTTVTSIIFANPSISPYRLMTNSVIKVPFKNDVVDANIDYTYAIMKNDIKGLKSRYPFLKIGTLGYSVMGRDLYFIKLGNGPNKVFYNGTHHSLEWITSVLLMKFIENYCKAFCENKKILEYDIREIYEKSTIYITPMVNPDGVDLVLNGFSKDNPYYNNLIKWNKENRDFSKNWQANIKGVDLNHNYDASWEDSKASEIEHGIFGPGPTRYSGKSPESEPESRAIAQFTRKNNFKLVLAYHSQGEVIYWNYNNLASKKFKDVGKKLESVSGYKLDETTGIASYSGYKDWFIKEFKKPGFTIEVGSGKNPLPIYQFEKIYNDNIELLMLASIINL